jgi:hypothetical protein
MECIYTVFHNLTYDLEGENPMVSRCSIVLAAFVAVLLFGGPALAGDTPSSIEPEAVEILKEMSEYMVPLKAFSVRFHETLDEELDSGQVVDGGRSVELSLRKPDRLRINSMAGTKVKEIYYSGKSVTVYDKNSNYYGTVDAPGTLRETKLFLAEEYGIVIPLADFIDRGALRTLAENAERGVVVGPAHVLGTLCNQLAFRQEDIDWQIWIQADGDPLPRKLVITDRKTEGNPRYTLILDSWTVNPDLPETLFTFVAPEGAEKIEFYQPDEEADSENPEKE